MLHNIAHLRFYIRQRFHRFRFMLADAQNKRAIAVDGDDIGVAARRAVLAHQAAVEDSFRDRLEIQLLRQAVAAKPAGFNHFKTGNLGCARQRLVIVARRVAHFLLQGIVRIQGFFLLHFRRNIVANLSQRFNLCCLNIVQTGNQEPNGGFNYARKLAFFFQTGLFQLWHGRRIFQPPHITAAAGRDNIG